MVFLAFVRQLVEENEHFELKPVVEECATLDFSCQRHAKWLAPLTNKNKLKDSWVSEWMFIFLELEIAGLLQNSKQNQHNIVLFHQHFVSLLMNTGFNKVCKIYGVASSGNAGHDVLADGFNSEFFKWLLYQE